MRKVCQECAVEIFLTDEQIVALGIPVEPGEKRKLPVKQGRGLRPVPKYRIVRSNRGLRNARRESTKVRRMVADRADAKEIGKVATARRHGASAPGRDPQARPGPDDLRRGLPSHGRHRPVRQHRWPLEAVAADFAVNVGVAEVVVERFKELGAASANRLEELAREAGRPEVPRRRLYKNGDEIDD